MIVRECCETCRWWHLRFKKGSRIVDRHTPSVEFTEYWPPKRGHDVGDCRLRAPTVMVHPAVNMDAPAEHRKPEYASTVWPQTKPGDFCGEWSLELPVEDRGLQMGVRP